LTTCPVVEIQINARSLRTVMTLRHSQGMELPVQIEAAPLMVDGELQVVEVLIPLERSIRFSQEQRLSTIGLLANGIAHEVHNPLASIRLALQASLRGLKEQNMGREELMEYLELVDHEIDRCVLITHRLLQMSAPPQETLQPVCFALALDDVLSLLRHECETRQVLIVKGLLQPELSVLADEAELRQVFINVLHNALHSMAGGGQVTVTGKLTADGRHYQMDFADTGGGIALEDKARIFLPFFSRRADGVRGTGLGLAICKGVMERFGGKITVDSELHRGSVFHLLLCLAPMDLATE
jgi:signal transduction histidine kinase